MRRASVHQRQQGDPAGVPGADHRDRERMGRRDLCGGADGAGRVSSEDQHSLPEHGGGVGGAGETGPMGRKR
nr:MAG TPA: hypothetical protein [Caudoviricetes sp.]